MQSSPPASGEPLPIKLHLDGLYYPIRDGTYQRFLLSREGAVGIKASFFMTTPVSWCIISWSYYEFQLASGSILQGLNRAIKPEPPGQFVPQY